jgi:hypothetical protein
LERDLAGLIVMFGGMRVKMQKMSVQMGGRGVHSPTSQLTLSRF